MSYPKEKALNNVLIVNESGPDVPVVSKASSQDAGFPKYTESKRTWKSFLWSSEPPIGGLQFKPSYLLF